MTQTQEQTFTTEDECLQARIREYEEEALNAYDLLDAFFVRNGTAVRASAPATAAAN